MCIKNVSSSSAGTWFVAGSFWLHLQGQWWRIHLSDDIEEDFNSFQPAIGAFKEKFGQISNDMVGSSSISWDISPNFSPNTLYMLRMSACKFKKYITK